MDIAALKRRAAERAVDFVESGMVLGLGHGSTAIFALRRIAAMLREGRLQDIQGVPCSSQVEEDARHLGIPLTTLDEHPVIDLTIDGADEVDPRLNLIKGGGGALLREKIVAQASRREIIVVDQTKFSLTLGARHSVPVEVISFGWRAQAVYMEGLGAHPILRLRDDADVDPFLGQHPGMPFTTDQGNLILDCHFGPIEEPEKLAAQMDKRAGLVDYGLFLGLATDVIIAGEGGIRHLKRGESYDHD